MQFDQHILFLGTETTIHALISRKTNQLAGHRQAHSIEGGYFGTRSDAEDVG
jgi:hypothetical protein